MRGVRFFSQTILGAALTAVGVAHVLRPGFFISIMPDYLGWHAELVYLSGAVEMLIGLAFVGAALAGACFAAHYGAHDITQYTACAAIALFFAVYPANIHMALHPDRYPDVPAWGLYLRLPVQFLFIAWAWWHTRPIAAPAHQP